MSRVQRNDYAYVFRHGIVSVHTTRTDEYVREDDDDDDDDDVVVVIV